MKIHTPKITRIFLSIITLNLIWQSQAVFANSIITPQPIFTDQFPASQTQNTPSNKSSQTQPVYTTPTPQQTTKKKTKKATVKKTTTKSATTKSTTVNQSKATTSKSVNSNSKTPVAPAPKNWERYIAPPIIIITIILLAVFNPKGRA